MTIKISSLVVNDEINISENQFSTLKENHTRDEIIDAISEAIDFYEIPMPLRHITREDAAASFIELCNFDAETLFNEGSTYSRYDYSYPMLDEYIGQSNVGNKASDFFHQERRFHCDSINSPSPYRSWTIPKFRRGFLKALFTMKFKEVNSNTLRNAIGLRKYIASQFKPSVAKYIYERYNSKRILDFSSGWGDRLAGFYAAPETQCYRGIDPNHTLQDGYLNQIKLYSETVKDKYATIHCSPAEDVLPTMNESFDTIFTSPPYFNIERYTQDENQSWKRYRKFETWLDTFMYPVLEHSWRMLEPNGHMIINISDVYSNHRVNQICDPMNDFISSLPNASYQGALGMRMSKRPNSKASVQDGIFVEPMWIFKKVE